MTEEGATGSGVGADSTFNSWMVSVAIAVENLYSSPGLIMPSNDVVSSRSSPIKIASTSKCPSPVPITFILYSPSTGSGIVINSGSSVPE